MSRADDKRIREALMDAIPAEEDAEERGWRVVREAFGDREPAPRRFGFRMRVGIAIAASGLVGGFALTPAGADVREWIADAISVGEEDARPVLGSLPTEGSVLAESSDGIWVLNDDGSRRRLGDYEHATWSPNGLFVAAGRGRELFALTPQGQVRWAITAPGRIRSLDWSTDPGFRIAYVAGNELRVVAGDGSRDRSVAKTLGSKAIAWRSGSLSGDVTHELTYVDAANRVISLDADSGQVLWRSQPVAASVASLQWSDGGERLLIGAEGFAFLLDSNGNAQFKGPIATGASFALTSDGSAIAVVRPNRKGLAELALVQPGQIPGDERLLYPVATRSGGVGFGPPAFSPDGEWLLLPWPQADQWIFIRISDRRVVPLGDISRQLDSDGRGDARFPRIAGWCC